MTKTDNQTPASSGDKVVRACPNNGLKQPLLRFEDTFSAEAVVMKAFFAEK